MRKDDVHGDGGAWRAWGVVVTCMRMATAKQGKKALNVGHMRSSHLRRASREKCAFLRGLCMRFEAACFASTTTFKLTRLEAG